MRFLSCAIMLMSKLSLVIGSTRLDIVDPDRLAHVILINYDHEFIIVGVWMLNPCCLSRGRSLDEDWV